MTPEKRRKIKAMLDNPASTNNEKDICRRILKENPESATEPPVCLRTPDGDLSSFFNRGFGGAASAQREAARRQQDVSRKSSWEKFRQKVYQTQEERDRVIVLQREAIQNSAQQRLADLLRNKK